MAFSGGIWIELASPAASLFAPGTGDFSMENWFHGRYAAEFGTGHISYFPFDWSTGFTAVSSLSGLQWNANAANLGWRLAFDAGGIVAEGEKRGVPYDDVYRWFYLCMNFDRSGDATLYVNAEPVDTLDISSKVAANYTGFICSAGEARDSSDNPVPMWTGPQAVHSRLLNQMEIRESYRQGTVRAVAETVFAIDPRDAIVFDVDYSIETDADQLDAYIGHTPPYVAANDNPSEESYMCAVASRRTVVINQPPNRTYTYGAVFPDMGPNGYQMVLGSRSVSGAGELVGPERYSSHIPSRKVT